MRTITKNVYTFDELSDKAKAKARDWWREHALDDQWYDVVYEDAEQIAKLLGITFKQKSYPTVGGGTLWEPCIWFSGFSSQGDGASFEGTYEYVKGSVKSLKEHAPEDKTLHQIVDSLYEIQKRHRFKVTATITTSGHGCHSGCADFDIEGLDSDSQAYADLQSTLREFMDWIYDQLRQQADYLLTDEAVDEAIADYEFNKNGTRFRDE